MSSLLRKIVLRALTLPFVLAIVMTALTTSEILYLRRLNGLTEHTQNVIATVSRTYRLTVDHETAIRGYLLTGGPQHLKPFEIATGQLDDTTARLARLVADNPRAARARAGAGRRDRRLEAHGRRQDGRLARRSADAAARGRHDCGAGRGQAPHGRHPRARRRHRRRGTAAARRAERDAGPAHAADVARRRAGRRTAGRRHHGDPGPADPRHRSHLPPGAA